MAAKRTKLLRVAHLADQIPLRLPLHLLLYHDCKSLVVGEKRPAVRWDTRGGGAERIMSRSRYLLRTWLSLCIRGRRNTREVSLPEKNGHEGTTLSPIVCIPQSIRWRLPLSFPSTPSFFFCSFPLSYCTPQVGHSVCSGVQAPAGMG